MTQSSYYVMSPKDIHHILSNSTAGSGLHLLRQEVEELFAHAISFDVRDVERFAIGEVRWEQPVLRKARSEFTAGEAFEGKGESGASEVVRAFE